jgi:hypothetical protein
VQRQPSSSDETAGDAVRAAGGAAALAGPAAATAATAAAGTAVWGKLARAGVAAA